VLHSEQKFDVRFKQKIVIKLKTESHSHRVHVGACTKEKKS